MDQNEWVSLGEAADILGVHPTTVRNWADGGDLPSQRTPGGHRRFLRSDLEMWMATRNVGVKDLAPNEARLMMQNALGRARIEVGGGQLSGIKWYDNLNEDTRRAHRALGRRLLELLTHFLVEPDKQAALSLQVRDLGYEYVQLTRTQHLSLSDSVRAFLFFRDLLTDSMIQLAETLSLRTPLDWSSRLRQVNHITDELLLTIIDGYTEEQPAE